MLPLAATILLAQLSGPAAAWSSARPPECTSVDPSRALNVWERAKNPKLRRYCDLLASGTSKLAGSAATPAEVLEVAEQAERAVPGKAAVRVLRARALLALGRVPDALAALKEAKAKDARALDDPHALFAWARALVRTGDLPEAASAYRTLLPRASTLSVADRVIVELEAGLLAMSRGPSEIDSAIAILRNAARESQDVLQVVSGTALALALDRAGGRDEARAVLAERARGDVGAILSGARAKEALGPLGQRELPALLGLALEAKDAAAARAHWARYEGGPWVDHARAHAGAPTPPRHR